MQTRVLFYAQHLLGIGHLMRASRIAAALARDFEVLLVLGGVVPPGFEVEGANVIELPPVRAEATGFGTLLHPDGSPFTTADKADRRDMLLALFDEFLPAVVMIEAFPFGRRQMRFELMPLLERASAAVHRPLIACSVRDILQPARPERRDETLALLRRYFGLVLVHGDPRLASFEDSFPEGGRLADLLAYTGLVGPAPRGPINMLRDPDDSYDVIVSVGGGAVGERLVRTAIAARPLSALAGARWLVLTGPASHEPERTADGLTIQRFVPDLADRLGQARVSVSQAGYNTVADILAARCRAVLVPFAAAGEIEQSRRATLLAERGLAVTLAEEELAAESLAAAIDAALALPEPGSDIALHGAAATRDILKRQLGMA